jgi:hypothetical protein
MTDAMIHMSLSIKTFYDLLSHTCGVLFFGVVLCQNCVVLCRFIMNKISIIQIIVVAILAAAGTDSVSISEDYEYKYETVIVTNKPERMVKRKCPIKTVEC